MEKLNRLLEHLNYTVVQGRTELEITELVYDSTDICQKNNQRLSFRMY